MTDPRKKPLACEKCDKEDCPMYAVDEINGEEICWEYIEEETKTKK